MGFFSKLLFRGCCSCIGSTPRRGCSCGCHNPCCSCYGADTQSYNCTCNCHPKDVEDWEITAFAWLVDHEDNQSDREYAWLRFLEAFPQYAHRTSCGEFWERIHKTRWYHRHGHRYRKHHGDYF